MVSSDRVLTHERRTACAICLAALFVAVGPSAQPIPVNYVIQLTSATNYDTRARDEDTIHAAVSVYVNGARKDTAIWDGIGWDGSRTEGRRWANGLHVFGASGASTVRVATGRLQDSDAVQVVFQILNAATPPTPANLESAADRIQQSSCEGGDDGSAWECIAPQAENILAGWSIAECDGLVAADKLAYTSLQLRRKTETGDTVTVSNNYRAASAPPGCGNSIYGAIVTMARQ